MSSRTAAVTRAYAHPPGVGKGILNYDQKGISREIERFDQAGYQVSVHAQGDRALEMVLKAFARVMVRGNPFRHQIVHAGNLTPRQIDKVEELGLCIASQANFFSLLGDGFIEAYGPSRSQTLYPVTALLRKGIKLVLSSDCPVAQPNPLIGVHDAVCRRTPRGQDFGPQECITSEQAIALYTRESAYFSFEEKERGTLKEGKFADLVVLGRDPLQIPPEEIPDCQSNNSGDTILNSLMDSCRNKRSNSYAGMSARADPWAARNLSFGYGIQGTVMEFRGHHTYFLTRRFHTDKTLTW